jgi:hypothetical protein
MYNTAVVESKEKKHSVKDFGAICRQFHQDFMHAFFKQNFGAKN